MSATTETQTATTLTTNETQTKEAPPASSDAPAKVKRQRQRRAKSGNRKDGGSDEAKKDASGSRQKPKQVRPTRERVPREREENLTNVITIGTRLPTNQYVRIVKNVLNLDKHEDLELHSKGQQGMAKLTQVVNILSQWGYIAVKKIKTRSEPALKITVKRTDDFQKNFDEFALVLQKRREERERLKAEKKAKEESVVADDQKDKVDTDAAAEAQAQSEVKADADLAFAVDSSAAASQPSAAEPEQTA